VQSLDRGFSWRRRLAGATKSRGKEPFVRSAAIFQNFLR